MSNPIKIENQPEATPRPDHRELLERKAELVRHRLLRTIDTLDRSRHAFVDAKSRIMTALEEWALPAGIALGVSIAAGGALAWRSQRKAELARRHTPAFWIDRATGRTPPATHHFGMELGKKLVTTVVLAVAGALAKQAATAVLTGSIGGARNARIRVDQT